VYPLARGLAPVLVLMLGAVLLGTGASGVQVLGVVAVGAGVLLVRGLRRDAGDAAGVVLALATAACIASYTLIDQRGVRHAAPLTYLELAMLIPAAGYAAGVARVRGTAALRRAVGPPALVAGVLIFVAYLLVLAALREAPAAAVAAVRESSVVIATGLGALVLHERVGATRFAGAVVVVAGIALLALG
jgi:drug/metabolite transporter (DMT)-like permease